MKGRNNARSMLWLMSLWPIKNCTSSLLVEKAPREKRRLRSHAISERSLEWTPIPNACSSSTCPLQTHQCLSNPNHPQRTTDDTCTPCQGSQTYWPCDVVGLCYCWDVTKPQIPPAPGTKSLNEGGSLENKSLGHYKWQISTVDPCDLLTEEVFKNLAPKAVHPYTYAGFCEAVRLYNVDHPLEGVFNMGSVENQKMELAAFLGNALHESDEFKAGREYLMCADQMTISGETYCKPCDISSFDWDTFKCSASLASEGRAFNSYCQSNLLPPDGCECDDVFEEGDLEGYVKADKVYFGRGSIQLSWNYNYIRASVALTGAPQTFCQRPDLVATKEEYAWGAGLFYWMENIKNDKTCHQSVLMNSDFGETLDNINGGLECPADDHGWHGKAVQLRLNRYCRAANALGLDRLLSLDGCMEMDSKMERCLEDGNCDDCKAFIGKIGLLEVGSNENVLPDTNASEEENSAEEEPEEEVPSVDQNNENAEEQHPEPEEASVETQELTAAPTSKPSNPPTATPTKQYIPRGPCSGEPCFIPPSLQNDPNNTLQFCRNAEGICGAGEIYCNADSIWTDFCHDCDSDESAYGCPTYGCSNCQGDTQICVGNLNGYNPIADEDCAPCAAGQKYWPCDIKSAEGCWCYDTTLPRVEPAPPSGLDLEDRSRNSASIGRGVCGVLIDEDLFDTLAPNAAAPFTYQGFCEAVDHYNAHHAEKIFRMGSHQERLSELAAFLGMASHETNGFIASREYLTCGDNKMIDGELYCKPCAANDYNYDSHTCGVSMLAGDQSYLNYCQPYTKPPDGCSCDYVKQVEPSGTLEGRMRANDIFFGRGSIQLSHNFNYIRASATMTGNEGTLCSQPEMLATDEIFSWGVGLYLWMDQMSKEGLTSHVSVLKNGDFGAALNIINGGNECPVDEENSFYSKAVMSRLDHYCFVAQVLGVPKLLELSGCEGLDDVLKLCMTNGGCPQCPISDHSSSNPKPLPLTLSTLPSVLTSNQGRPENQETQDNTTTETSSTTTVTTVFSTDTSISTDRPPRTHGPTIRPSKRPTRVPRTSKPSTTPSDAPTTNPTSSPTSSPIVDENKDDSAGQDFASQFAFHGLTISSHNADESDKTTHADSFALTSHSKESNSVVSLPIHTRTKSPTLSPISNSPTVSPTTQLPSSSPVAKMETKMATPLDGNDGEMTNWALTKLEDENETNGSGPPTESPVNNNIVNVQDIVFRPQSKTEEESQSAPDNHNGLTMSDVGTIVELTSPTLEELPGDPTMAKPSVELSADANQEEPTIVETNQPIGTVSGRIWLETEEGEDVGLRGILVDLFECDSEGWVEGTRTASAGDYMFDELQDGKYYVVVAASHSYRFVEGSDKSDVNPEGRGKCVEVSSALQSHTVNAGLVKLAMPTNVDESLESKADNTLEKVVDLSVGVSHADLESNSDSVSETIADSASELPHNCRGQPCVEGDGTWCRSKYSFCGEGEAFCNAESQWTPDCGTGTPTKSPSTTPTTGRPTFAFDLTKQCNGEPCTDGDGTWCRSDVGYCGSGYLYCNSDSIWLPECVTVEPTKSPSQVTSVSSTVLTVPESDEPSAAPHQSPKGKHEGFSSFALPTLTEINPKEQESNIISVSGHERTSIQNKDLLPTISDENDEADHGDDDKEIKQESTFHESWFEKYSYLDSLATSSNGFQSNIGYQTLIVFLIGMLLPL